MDAVKKGIKSAWKNELEHIDVPRIELRGSWVTEEGADAWTSGDVFKRGSHPLSKVIAIKPIPDRIFFVARILPGAL